MTIEKPASYQSDRNLALDLVRVVEAAALCRQLVDGQGQQERGRWRRDRGDAQARFDSMPINGTVVIGEGEMDEAPMLYIGEKVGAGGPAMDIAVDPLEGTTLTAKVGPNALTVIAMAEHGHFLHAPDVYMEKIAVGGGLPDGVVHIDAPVGENLRNLAQAKKLRYFRPRALHAGPRPPCRHHSRRARGRRPRHAAAGWRRGGVVATTLPEGDVDIFIGTGGAPEGVLAAAALRCTGGQMQGRLQFENDADVERPARWASPIRDKIYEIEELAGGDVMFAATGVTTGAMLRGVRPTGTAPPRIR